MGVFDAIVGRSVGATLLLGLPLMACNGIAGIADLHTGELDAATDGPIEGAKPDGATADGASNDGGAALTDAAGDTGSLDDAADADAGPPPPPACNAPQIGLRIAVIDSATGQFTGIVDMTDSISVYVGGSPFTGCFPSGTSFNFQAMPDDSSAKHDWGGVCPLGRRCMFTLTEPTSIDVHLQ